MVFRIFQSFQMCVECRVRGSVRIGEGGFLDSLGLVPQGFGFVWLGFPNFSEFQVCVGLDLGGLNEVWGFRCFLLFCF